MDALIIQFGMVLCPTSGRMDHIQCEGRDADNPPASSARGGAPYRPSRGVAR